MAKKGDTMYVRKGMRKGTVLNKLNNGWYMLQFEDGSKNRFPPSMLTAEGPKEEEKAAEPAEAAAPTPQSGQAAPAAPPQVPTVVANQPPANTYPTYTQQPQATIPDWGRRQSFRVKLPAPNSQVAGVCQWMSQIGFGHHTKDAQTNLVDGWSLRYLQHAADKSTPKDFAQIVRQHFPRMAIGEISSLGGRLMYNPATNAWI